MRLNVSGIVCNRTPNAIGIENIMKSIIRIIFVCMLIAISAVSADNIILHEIDGREVNDFNRTKGPKALVKELQSKVVNAPVQKVFFASQDSFRVALRDSIHWFEMEKNTDYTICTDDVNEGIWKGIDFSFQRINNCILLNSGNYVKNGKIWYITKMGNVHTFNLLVGMKYVDLSTRNHLLGSEMDCSYSKSGKCYYRDPLRVERIEKILAVDKYKVTECEFVNALWDSIPAQTNKNLGDNNNFWIEKKKTMKKNGYCDTHDSAAVRINFYHALVYANARSLRDGFEPVYFLKKTENKERSFKDDGSFNIENTSFFESSLKDGKYIHVEIDKSANGFRLPYYDEWMALAGAGLKGFYDDESLKDDSSRTAQYAWFGVVESDDYYATLNKKKYADQLILNHSCGEWLQNSRPVGVLKPNGYGLYDIFGLVCEKTLLPGKSLFHGEVSLCKGGFLTSTFDEMNFRKTRCGDDGFANKKFQGLRLVRQIR